MKAQRGVGIDVALADLEKAAACGKNRNALLKEGAGQGIEYDIDAAAIGFPSHVIREGERSRVEYMLDPASIEIASLLLAAGGRENVRALRLGDADRRQPDPSRRGMDRSRKRLPPPATIGQDQPESDKRAGLCRQCLDRRRKA